MVYWRNKFRWTILEKNSSSNTAVRKIGNNVVAMKTLLSTKHCSLQIFSFDKDGGLFYTLGSLRNDDEDGNEKAKKQQV